MRIIETGDSTIRFDPINLKFQLIRWAAIVLALALPALAWLIATGRLDLKPITAIEITLVAILLSTIILKLVSHYLREGFIRSYMDSDNWDYLSARFGVARLPPIFAAADRLEGHGQLDRDDVVFAMDAAVSDAGLYVNLLPFGRLLIPWTAIQMLRRRQLMTAAGAQDSVSVTLYGPACALCVPWKPGFDATVPASVGIS